MEMRLAEFAELGNNTQLKEGNGGGVCGGLLLPVRGVHQQRSPLHSNSHWGFFFRIDSIYLKRCLVMSSNAVRSMLGADSVFLDCPATANPATGGTQKASNAMIRTSRPHSGADCMWASDPRKNLYRPLNLQTLSRFPLPPPPTLTNPCHSKGLRMFDNPL